MPRPTKLHLARLALLVLAACGADSSPTPPAASSGLSVSGTARVGVSTSY